MPDIAEFPSALVPEFRSDRMRILAPLITPRIVQLAHFRLCGGELVCGKELAVSDSRWAVKLALLVVLEMWPHERFTVEEEGIMRSMNADNVNPYKKQGLIRAF